MAPELVAGGGYGGLIREKPHCAEAQMYPETRADMGRSRRPLVTRDEICDSAM